jgi:hypothetical protein
VHYCSTNASETVQYNEVKPTVDGIGLVCQRSSSSFCGSDSSFAVMVRPDSLNVTTSGPGPFFDTTEAGRRTSFEVIPRDRYGNNRNRTHFQTSDSCEVLIHRHQGSANVANPCVSMPCQNGGTCTTSDDDTEVVGGSFHCECLQGWSGLHCSVSPFQTSHFHPCRRHPCHGAANVATLNITCVECSPLETPQCSNGYICVPDGDCRRNHSTIERNSTAGHSDRPNPTDSVKTCMTLPPQEGGIWTGTFTAKSTATLTCLPGYHLPLGAKAELHCDCPCALGSCPCTWDGAPSTCMQEPALITCANQPCQNGGTCTPTPYTCAAGSQPAVADGTWSVSPTGDSFAVSDTSTLSCNLGFTPSPAGATVTCQSGVGGGAPSFAWTSMFPGMCVASAPVTPPEPEPEPKPTAPVTPDRYTCHCPVEIFSQRPAFFGKNCQSSEDDCRTFTAGLNPCMDWNAPDYDPTKPRCVECNRVEAGCSMGYTCMSNVFEPEPEPVSLPCVDTQFNAALSEVSAKCCSLAGIDCTHLPSTCTASCRSAFVPFMNNCASQLTSELLPEFVQFLHLCNHSGHRRRTQSNTDSVTLGENRDHACNTCVSPLACPIVCGTISWVPHKSAFVPEFAATIAGVYQLVVKLGDETAIHAPHPVPAAEISTSAARPQTAPDLGLTTFQIVVLPGVLAIGKSTVRPLWRSEAQQQGRQWDILTAKSNLTWIVAAKDQYGNSRMASNDTVALTVVKGDDHNNHLVCNGSASFLIVNGKYMPRSRQQCLACNFGVPNATATIDALHAGQYRVTLTLQKSSDSQEDMYSSTIHLQGSRLSRCPVWSEGDGSPDGACSCVGCGLTTATTPANVIYSSGIPAPSIRGGMPLLVQPGPLEPRRHIVNGCLLYNDEQCWQSRQPQLTMPSRDNMITIRLRDRYDNLRSGFIDASVTGSQRGLDVATCTINRQVQCGSGSATPSGEGIQPSGMFMAGQDVESQVLLRFASLEEWKYNVTLRIDSDANARVIEYRYGVHTSLNMSRCQVLRCGRHFEFDLSPPNMLTQNELAQCTEAGCMFIGASTANNITVTVETGYWAPTPGTAATEPWQRDSQFHPLTITLRPQDVANCKSNNTGALYWLCGTAPRNFSSLVLSTPWNPSAEGVMSTMLPRTQFAGVYSLELSVQAQTGYVSAVYTPMVNISMAPGRTDFVHTSIIETPVRVASHVYQVGTGVVDDVSVQWGYQLVVGPNQISDVTYRFAVRLFDEAGMPRYGRDYVRIQISKVGVLNKDFGGELQPKNSTTETHAGLYQSDFRFSKFGVFCGSDPTPINDAAFDPSGLGGFGEFTMRAWVCTEDADCHTVNDDQQMWSSSVEGSPQWRELTYFQDLDGKRKSTSDAFSAHGLSFTICPANVSGCLVCRL